jgi:NADH-quinone oxidoreductase subunit A
MLINLKFSFFALSGFCIISVFLSILLLSFSYGHKVTNSSIKDGVENLSPYECGFEPFSSGSLFFDVHFYIVGILFIIFDLEIVFLFILTIGFVFEWNKGGKAKKNTET